MRKYLSMMLILVCLLITVSSGSVSATGITPTNFKCPLSEHNFACINETIIEENSTHGLYVHIYDEKGNLVDRLKVGICNDTLPIHTFDYACTACSANYSKSSNGDVIHHPSYNDSVIRRSAD